MVDRLVLIHDVNRRAKRAAYLRVRKNPEVARQKEMRRRHRLRERLLIFYGTVCVLCGESDKAVLCIDHANGGGNRDRANRSRGQTHRMILKAADPDAYRTLCCNCNLREQVSRAREARTNAEAAHYNDRYKLRALLRYGMTCVGCGETDADCLTIHHVNGGGGQSRRVEGNKLCQWLWTNGYPEGYQTLCSNCNWRVYIAS